MNNRRLLIGCSWCHELNEAVLRFCNSCGHRNLVPRALCDCGRLGCHSPNWDRTKVYLEEFWPER